MPKIDSQTSLKVQIYEVVIEFGPETHCMSSLSPDQDCWLHDNSLFTYTLCTLFMSRSQNVGGESAFLSDKNVRQDVKMSDKTPFSSDIWSRWTSGSFWALQIWQCTTTHEDTSTEQELVWISGHGDVVAAGFRQRYNTMGKQLDAYGLFL